MTEYEYTEGGHVESSALDSVFYDADTKTLYVVFHNGRLAAYGDVESSTYKSLVEADSIGSFYNRYIYDNASFKGVSVEQEAYFTPRHPLPTTTEACEAPHPKSGPTRKVTIHYSYVVDDAVEIDAADIEDALRQFNEQAENYSGLKVRKIEVSFDD